MLNTYRILAEKMVYARLEDLAGTVNDFFKSTVAYGPFKGMKFSNQATWSRLDRGSMLLGIYEKEIQESLSQVPASHNTFIDIGAADGYYAVGVLVGKLFVKTHCFEMNEASRNVIRINAELNHVDDRIAIDGAAEKDFWKILPAKTLETSVVLIDIEGAEFDLMDNDFLDAFKASIIIVELHDAQKDGPARVQELKTNAARFFTLTELKTGARDMSQFRELATLSDNDRWLLCSERRHKAGAWLRLDPK